MTDSRHISPEDLALHAMQALAPEDSAAVRAHLAQCAQCRDELAALTGDLALVALSADQQPLPVGARDRFLAKLPSIGAEPATRPAAPQIVSIAPKKRSTAAIWIPWLAVAALLVLSVALSFQIRELETALQSQSEAAARLTAASARAQQVLDVLSAPAAQRVLLTAAKTPPQPTGRAVYLASRGSLIFQGSNLAQIAADKTYELWVIPATGAPVPAGLFRPDASGSGSVVMPPMIPRGLTAKAFAITIENAEGSATPTMPILLSGAAPAGGE